MTPALEMRFWGVRGSTPTPVAKNLGVGGNTTCLELRSQWSTPAGRVPVIFDAGTGISQLGSALMKEFPGGGECHIFFTHFHWDHVQGLPFFVPLYRPEWTITFHSRLEGSELEMLLGEQMRAPFFPVPFGVTGSRKSFCMLPEGEVRMGELSIRPFPLHHPNGVRGFRMEAGGRSIVLATDHEHGQGAFDEGLAKMAAGANVLIYDAQYTPEEYESRHGWGHSTAQAGGCVASKVGVEQLILFHHDPGHDDEAIGGILAAGRAIFPNMIVGSEGLAVRLCAR